MCYDEDIRVAGIKQALDRQRHIRKEAWVAAVRRSAANLERQRREAGNTPATNQCLASECGTQTTNTNWCDKCIQADNTRSNRSVSFPFLSG
jgi:hypothetical protein